jgi:hypothetical protein
VKESANRAAGLAPTQSSVCDLNIPSTQSTPVKRAFRQIAPKPTEENPVLECASFGRTTGAWCVLCSTFENNITIIVEGSRAGNSSENVTIEFYRPDITDMKISGLKITYTNMKKKHFTPCCSFKIIS